MDLGSGAGFDVFLAARKIGPEGKAIGVDMSKVIIIQICLSRYILKGPLNVAFISKE